MGAMTIDGQKGKKFEDYVDSLKAVNASRGYFTVHNILDVKLTSKSTHYQ
jgi:hypothetical protein